VSATKQQGTLIEIEGLDGSGKSTQIALLREALEARGLSPLCIKLPHYDDDSSLLVRRYLAGTFGAKPGDVNAYQASTFYAADRVSGYKTRWGADYESGRILLADRYTGANAFHQAAKLPESEWASFFAWLYDFEYNKLALPKPDLVVFLDMPPAVSSKLLSDRYQGDESKRDLHEADYTYLLRCREAALAAAEQADWAVIPCAEGDSPKSKESIHADILKHIGRILA
jgi:dTMP kinase